MTENDRVCRRTFLRTGAGAGVAAAASAAGLAAAQEGGGNESGANATEGNATGGNATGGNASAPAQEEAGGGGESTFDPGFNFVLAFVAVVLAVLSPIAFAVLLFARGRGRGPPPEE
ncbi:hypothetical protein ACFQPA_11945 [Halomarina halobia]|uniref:Twin-arginine translocation signal domain-containing protein n=1 Tax=Halomarina halobia TaxID=3033386 RepID=A0ABD6AA08_9EURY|nr:hypothetical protein [Halomarina sp. PSR21]